MSLCSQQTNLPMEVVRELSDRMIDFYSQYNGRRGLRGDRGTFNTDPWSCCICATVLVEPMSLPCGHSVCKKCLAKDISGLCRKCGTKYDHPEALKQVKVSILVSDLVTKFWTKELKAVNLRNEGNRQFQRGLLKDSISSYEEAFNLSPEDHLVTSNKSHALFSNKQHQAALEDANRSVVSKPDWGKGYFRRGMALAALNKHDLALVAFFQCLVLEENCSKALRAEIYKVIFRLISHRTSSETEDIGGINPGSASKVKFMSHPDLRDTGSTDLNGSTGMASESDDSESDETDTSTVNTEEELARRKMKESQKLLVSRNRQLCKVLDKVEKAVEAVLTQNSQQKNRHIDPAAVDPSDFDCSLCFRMLWQPTTTLCGHTYCKACIDRSLDHKRECPLCKTALEAQHSVKMGVNEFVEETIRRMLLTEYVERQKAFEEEMNDLIGSNTDGTNNIPVFVCTMSFPHIPCPLHVFEPRYRLMIRRTMEAGTREFGMCTNSSDKPFSDYGTMLEIRDIQFFPDGRSVVDTMGGRRFRVLSRSSKDGYQTAEVEFLHDLVPEGQSLLELQQLHDRTKELALSWFSKHSAEIKAGILSHYGAMPPMEQDYWTLPSGPAWTWWVLAILPLDSQAQLQILSQTQLKKRLEAIGRILGFMRRNQSYPMDT